MLSSNKLDYYVLLLCYRIDLGDGSTIAIGSTAIGTVSHVIYTCGMA